MTRHARTGILLCGWLLMQPPSPDVTRDGKYVDRAGKATGIGGEPVTEWYQVAAFDTAERCERARLEGHQQLAAAVKKKPRAADMHPRTLAGIPIPSIPPFSPAQARAMQELILTLDSLSRCVPAEAVYPPAQQGR